MQTNAYSHEVDARGSQTLGWQSEDVSRVVSFTPYGAAGKVVTIEGKQCLHGFQFYFDVLESAATNSFATLTGGPFVRDGFQPCATARMSFACAGDLLGISDTSVG